MYMETPVPYKTGSTQCKGSDGPKSKRLLLRGELKEGEGKDHFLSSESNYMLLTTGKISEEHPQKKKKGGEIGTKIKLTSVYSVIF